MNARASANGPLPGAAGAPRTVRPDRRATGAGLLAAAGALALLPLPVGLPVAVASVAVLPRWLSTLETTTARRRRSRCLRDLPLAADLFAACVLGGAAPAHAAAVVADAIGGPLGESLAATSRSLSLGADPALAWLAFGEEPVLASWGRALARSARSGAPVAAVVTRIADDARAVRRTTAAAAARRATVTATLPLGLCFLPAFLLAGVAPLIVGFVLPVLGLLA